MKRRALVGVAGVAAAQILGRRVASAETNGADAAVVDLRVLETSDLHMFAYDYDYYNGRQDDTVGLAKVGTLIARARAECANSLLFDNGDIIQGNPLGDYMALPGHLSARYGHPMFRAMNRLGYDGATLGNHEFNYGLDFLKAALGSAKFPFVCANVTLSTGGTLLPPTMVIERSVTDRRGNRHTLRIGLIGLVTPQIMVWDRAKLQGKVDTIDIVDAARRHVPALRRRCDLLIALCHSGIAGGQRIGGEENAALHLAAVPGIDVILTGHAHRVFPGPDYEGINGADAKRGTLAGVPAVMPGFWGSHLGLVDLALQRDQGGTWSIQQFSVAVRPIYRRDGSRTVPLVADDRAILDAARPEHEATLRWMEQPVGRTTVPINTFLSLLGNDAALSLINAAQLAYAAPLIADTAYAGLPLLSAASPFKAGGAGPNSFVDIPAGPMDMKDIANLYMFANTVCVVKLTGAELRDWLERSCAIFAQIDPDVTTPQTLLVPQAPSYLFDTVAGLRYEIDLSQPSRFDRNGRCVAPDARRITSLTRNNRPVMADEEFLVVTNNYRAYGGGGFPGTGGAHVVLNAPDLVRDVLVRYVAQKRTVSPLAEPVWRLRPMRRAVTLLFDGNAGTASHLGNRSDIRRFGDGDGGFVRYALTLDAA